MTWEIEVKSELGPNVFETLLGAVDSGVITFRKAKSIAPKLHSSVNGKLQSSIDSAGGTYQFDRSEFKQILSDWYVADQENVTVNRLIDVLRSKDVDLRPLAKQLTKMVESP